MYCMRIKKSSLRMLVTILVFLLIMHPGLSTEEKLFNNIHTLLVPNIVHQTYDYQAPNFFLYLSLMCIQRFVKPEKHILWVNDEGRYRKGYWDGWQQKVVKGSWEYNLTTLIKDNKLEIKFLTFPGHPPGNESIYAPNKAHRSDFVRMSALYSMGGIYLDTDAFAIRSLDELRIHNFSLSFDNIVNSDSAAHKRCNNGVLLSSPQSLFLKLWIREYSHFNPASFDYDSSVVPYRIATQYPDLVNIEMSRISPISFGFQTNTVAEAITCGIYVPPSSGNGFMSAIWHPNYNFNTKSFSYEGTAPDVYMFNEVSKKLVLHLTMSQERGICMMRKHLSAPDDLQNMPSLLGRIFRIALHGSDDFNYQQYLGGAAAGTEARNNAWKMCRDMLGMHSTPVKDDGSGSTRQQYTNIVEV